MDLQLLSLMELNGSPMILKNLLGFAQLASKSFALVNNQRKNPFIGDLVSLHSPEGDPEVIDLGVVVDIYPKTTPYGTPVGYVTYAVVGRSGKPYEYDEPYWEARIVSPIK